MNNLFFITCASGFEQTLCEELNEIYTSFKVTADVYTGSAGCYVKGNFDCCLLANLYSFCASRVLFIAQECTVNTEQELYDAVCEIDWPSFFVVEKNFAVKANVSQSFLQNSMYLSLKVKDALCDTFIKKINKRPNVDIHNPDVRVYVRLVQNRLSVSLDTTGESLFMRGYKKNSHEAPLKETLAASLLRISGWNKVTNSIAQSNIPVYFERVEDAQRADHLARASVEEVRKIPKQVLLAPFFMDQFCGSGTIVIEAALALMQFNPNCLREHFAFMDLFPAQQAAIQEKYKELKEQVLQKKKNVAEIKEAINLYAAHNHIEHTEFPLHANDISEAAVTLAKESAQNAGVSELIHFSCLPAEETKAHSGCGLIIINPPYGERIGSKENLPKLYKTIGDTWKKNFPNWTAWLLSSNESLTKSVGLRATRKFTVYNGNLECRFLQYVMYPFQKK